MLQPGWKAKLESAEGQPQVAEILDKAEYAVRGQCKQHNYMCRFPTGVDLSVFGAPCVDDSSMRTLQQDQGNSRRDSCLKHIFLLVEVGAKECRRSI